MEEQISGTDKLIIDLYNEHGSVNRVIDCTGYSHGKIKKCLLDRAEKAGDLEMYECPFPVKYVLEKGYRLHKGIVVCDGVYDPEHGLMIPDGYEEY